LVWILLVNVLVSLSSMATADAIRAQIAACKQEQEQVLAERERARQEKKEAHAKQKLRRDLETENALLAWQRRRLTADRVYIQGVENDTAGPHVADADSEEEMDSHPKLSSETREVVTGVVDCAAEIVTGEIEWSIRGFSWLQEALKQNGEEHTVSPSMAVAEHRFILIYHPKKGSVGSPNQRGSLAIHHEDERGKDFGVTFRYTLWIKSKERGYVQWGDSGNICEPEAEDMLFGPDVCSSSTTPSGIFGLSHDQLMQSEWVTDDVLTAKLQVHLRPESPLKDEGKVVDTISVPDSSFIDDFLHLLDTAAGCDVTFNVQGDSIKAHSPILSARSEVLKRQFFCGMQESTSKEVTIQDCEPMIFRAFLRYLYGDSLSSMESLVASVASSGGPVVGTTPANGTKLPILQQLLAISHKYQVTRLQAWCELQLCKLISNEAACSILLQAHLYDAKQLEKKCLEFIAANMNEVAKTEAFSSVNQHWPQVSLKIFLCLGRVSAGSAATAMEVQENMLKRKRED